MIKSKLVSDVDARSHDSWRRRNFEKSLSHGRETQELNWLHEVTRKRISDFDVYSACVDVLIKCNMTPDSRCVNAHTYIKSSS